MRKPPPIMPDSRIWSHVQVAARLGRGSQWLYDNLPRLKQIGFPLKDRDLGGYDSHAVEAWLDRRAGIDANMGVEAEMLEAARGKSEFTLHS